MVRLRTSVGILCTLLVAGCSATNSGTIDSESTQATTTRPGPAPTTTAALPTVTFDPCEKIGDDLLMRFTLDPTSRKGYEDVIGRETIRACNAIGDDRSVGFIAQNTPWEEIPFRVTPRPLAINGREAWYVPGGSTEDSCSVLMRTDFGALVVNSTPAMGRRPDPTKDRCDRIIEIAEAVEPLLADSI